MAPHSSILAWRIPWTEEPGGLQSMGSQSQTQMKLPSMPESPSKQGLFFCRLKRRLSLSTGSILQGSGSQTIWHQRLISRKTIFPQTQGWFGDDSRTLHLLCTLFLLLLHQFHLRSSGCSSGDWGPLFQGTKALFGLKGIKSVNITNKFAREEGGWNTLAY